MMRISSAKVCLFSMVVIMAALGASNSIEAQQQAPLQLSTAVVDTKYCTGDSELDRLATKLKLTYINTGNGPIILYKGSSLISQIMISQSAADAAAKRFEVNSSLTQLTSAGTACYKGSTPSNCFVVLQPGSSYETETVASLFAVRGDARQISGAVKSANHVLQLEILTWYESKSLAQTLGARWRRYGTIRYEPVISDPMLIRIEKLRKVADCP